MAPAASNAMSHRRSTTGNRETGVAFRFVCALLLMGTASYGVDAENVRTGAAAGDAVLEDAEVPNAELDPTVAVRVTRDNKKNDSKPKVTRPGAPGGGGAKKNNDRDGDDGESEVLDGRFFGGGKKSDGGDTRDDNDDPPPPASNNGGSNGGGTKTPVNGGGGGGGGGNGVFGGWIVNCKAVKRACINYCKKNPEGRICQSCPDRLANACGTNLFPPPPAEIVDQSPPPPGEAAVPPNPPPNPPPSPPPSPPPPPPSESEACKRWEHLCRDPGPCDLPEPPLYCNRCAFLLAYYCNREAASSADILLAEEFGASMGAVDEVADDKINMKDSRRVAAGSG